MEDNDGENVFTHCILCFCCTYFCSSQSLLEYIFWQICGSKTFEDFGFERFTRKTTNQPVVSEANCVFTSLLSSCDPGVCDVRVRQPGKSLHETQEVSRWPCTALVFSSVTTHQLPQCNQKGNTGALLYMCICLDVIYRSFPVTSISIQRPIPANEIWDGSESCLSKTTSLMTKTRLQGPFSAVAMEAGMTGRWRVRVLNPCVYGELVGEAEDPPSGTCTSL